MDPMLGALVILCAIMYIYLFELVSIGERAPGNVDVVFRVLIHSEHDGLSRVVQCSANLK